MSLPFCGNRVPTPRAPYCVLPLRKHIPTCLPSSLILRHPQYFREAWPRLLSEFLGALSRLSARRTLDPDQVLVAYERDLDVCSSSDTCLAKHASLESRQAEVVGDVL